MFGLLVGAGVAALGICLLRTTVLSAFQRGSSALFRLTRLVVVQPILLAVPLLLIAIWKPEELMYAAIGLIGPYAGFSACAAVRVRAELRQAKEG